MPFTLAHPAAVLPIHSRWKRWLALTPLAVGSMVPDAGYYLPLPESYNANAHAWVAGLYFSVPVGVAMLLIFYWVAPEIAFLLPSPHREALQRWTKGPTLAVRNALLAACGIIIGAEAHITWDSFTHYDGWMVKHILFLREPIARMPPYFVLQVLSSIAGMWILAYVYDRWAKSEGFRLWTWRDSSWRAWLWFVVLAECFVLAVIESHVVQAIVSLTFPYQRHFAVVLLTSFVRNFLVTLCVLAIYIKVFGRRARLDVAY